MAMPKAYEGNEPYIFISYAHKDSDKVIPMIQALQDRGFRVWFDAGIEAGSEWPAYIAMHLSNCGCFIPFLTPNYMASDNCRQEIYFALRKKRTLLPVYLEEAELDIGLEMQLSPIQALMLQKSMGTDALLQEMCKSAKLQPCMGKAPAPTAKPTPKPAPASQPAPKPSTPAELYQQGKKLYDKSRYTEAFPLLQKAAEQGYADAQFQLGWCYFCGNGVTQNMKIATEWYRKAADLGHAKAQCELAYCYFKGHGVSSSDAEAFKWYQKAAELGFAKAQYELARCYKFGYGVTQDPKQALYWMQKAAQQKYQDAESLAKDWAEDYRLQNMTPAECLKLGKQHFLNKEHTEAVNMFRRGADRGNAECHYLLGNCYYTGWGLAKNLEEAVNCYKKAAELGHIDAQCKLADFYVQGYGVAKSYPEAIKWYKKAASQNNAQAQYTLAWIYFYGNNGAQDLESAIYWAKKAAAQKYKESEVMVEQWSASLATQQMTPEESAQKADLFYKDKKYTEALDWYKTAATKGHMESAFRLAEFYDAGLTDDTGSVIVSRDLNAAEKWYDKAAQLGHPLAKVLSTSCRSELIDGRKWDTPEKAAAYWFNQGKSIYTRQEEKEEFYRRAARTGHLEAQRKLARLGDRDYQMPEVTNPAEITYWCQKAAAQGCPESMCKVGFQHYEAGNYSIALELFRKAESAGYYLGTYFLGCCYAEGKGVPQDCIQAWDLWFSLPSENALVWIAGRYGKYYYDAARRMTYQSFPRWYQSLIDKHGKYTKEQIHTWLEKTAMSRSSVLDHRALEDLAFAFDEAKQYTPALILFRNLPKTYAQLRMGEYFIHGRGVEQDPSEAAKWFHLAADNPDQQLEAHPSSPSIYACAWLSILYKHGIGVKKNWLSAQKWKAECGNHKKRGHSKYGSTEETLKHFESELASAVTGV